MHCVFYFLDAHRIKTIDKEFLKQFDGVANVVLIISKADCMTYNERMDSLRAVNALIKEVGNSVLYDFHDDEEEEDFHKEKEDPLETGSTKCTGATDTGKNTMYQQSSSNDDVSEDTRSRDSSDSSCIFIGDTEEQGKDTASSAIVTTTVCRNFANAHGDKGMFEHQEDIDGVLKTQTKYNSRSRSNSSTTYDAENNNNNGQCNLSTHNSSSNNNNNTSNSNNCNDKLCGNVFAVICDSTGLGKRVYPWGTINIYNESHSDLRRLQRLLLESSNIIKMRHDTQLLSIELYKHSPQLLHDSSNSSSGSSKDNIMSSDEEEEVELNQLCLWGRALWMISLALMVLLALILLTAVMTIAACSK